MSATVHYSFAPHIAVSNVCGAPFNADMQARYRAGRPDQNPPGQLWERVAETPSNAPAPLTARQDEGIVRAYAAMKGGRGTPLTQWPANARGIIRAGRRIK